MRTSYITWLLICAVLACCVYHWWMGGYNAEPVTVCDDIPSLAEIQTMIGVEADGIYGPETKKAWNLAINQQFADKHENGFYED